MENSKFNNYEESEKQTRKESLSIYPYGLKLQVSNNFEYEGIDKETYNAIMCFLYAEGNKIYDDMRYYKNDIDIFKSLESKYNTIKDMKYKATIQYELYLSKSKNKKVVENN